MQSYTFKTYISNRREYFCYGRGASLTKKTSRFRNVIKLRDFKRRMRRIRLLIHCRRLGKC